MKDDTNKVAGQPAVSIIIPARDERDGIGPCLKELNQIIAQHKLNAEVIVSDSSSDGTTEIARSLGAHVVSPDRRGYGYAVIYAISRSRGNLLVMADADGTYSLSDIPQLIEPVRRGEADMVIGSRYHGAIQPGSMPWLHRYFGNPMLTWTMNRLLGLHLSDSHSGFRAFTRKTWSQMQPKLLEEEFCSEMTRALGRTRLRVVEISTCYRARSGKSKLGTWHHGWKCLRFILWHILLHR